MAAFEDQYKYEEGCSGAMYFRVVDPPTESELQERLLGIADTKFFTYCDKDMEQIYTRWKGSLGCKECSPSGCICETVERDTNG